MPASRGCSHLGSSFARESSRQGGPTVAGKDLCRSANRGANVRSTVPVPLLIHLDWSQVAASREVFPGREDLHVATRCQNQGLSFSMVRLPSGRPENRLSQHPAEGGKRVIHLLQSIYQGYKEFNKRALIAARATTL